MDKVAKILELQGQGLSIEEIAKELEYKEVRSMSTFMRKNGYRQENRKFVPRGENELMEKNANRSVKNERVKKDVKVDSAGLQAISVEDLKEIKENISAIRDFVIDTKYRRDLIIDGKKLDLKNYSIRVDKDALEKFDAVCEKYNHISKYYLFTKALEEFAEKYL